MINIGDKFKDEDNYEYEILAISPEKGFWGLNLDEEYEDGAEDTRKTYWCFAKVVYENIIGYDCIDIKFFEKDCKKCN